MTTTPLTSQEVLESLKDVHDPEIPCNVVDLGLIYEVHISPENSVHLKVSLTSPGCSYTAYLIQQMRWAVQSTGKAQGVKVDVVFDPPWTQDMITEDGRKLLGVD